MTGLTEEQIERAAAASDIILKALKECMVDDAKVVIAALGVTLGATAVFSKDPNGAMRLAQTIADGVIDRANHTQEDAG